MNAHGLHSPFVYEFYTKVVKSAKKRNENRIEKLRKSLIKDQSIVEVSDLGAGSKSSKSTQRKINEITKSASIPPKFGRLIQAIIGFYNCKELLELGTSMGIGSAYMASASNSPRLTTIEGCPNIAAKAKANFDALNLDNIDLLIGDFDTVLGNKINPDKIFDLIYIDGNHAYEPTIRYFEFALKHTNEDSFIVFDDIYWSDGMTEAWEEIKKSDKIHVSMDLFRMGIVCKKQKQRKQDFILKY